MNNIAKTQKVLDELKAEYDKRPKEPYTGMSYIVKNCPAILKMTKICDAYETTRDNPEFCKDIENCVMKQIVDILRENTCKPEECGMNEPDWNGEVFGCNAGFDDNVSGCSCALANNLLRKLDIEEINK